MDPSLLALVSQFIGSNNESVASRQPDIRTDNETSARPLGSEKKPRFHVLIFSKDRPWQLLQLLRSMRMTDTQHFETTVIVNIQSLFKNAYQQLMDDYKQIEFQVESDEMTFQDLLSTLIQQRRNEENLRWIFLTDDCFFLEPLEQVAMESISSEVFLSRLHPGISWCQTRNMPSMPPRNHLRYCHASNSFTYPLSQAHVDWAYTWDLSGGIYPNLIVQEVFEQLDEDAKSHPNKLEFAAHCILRKKQSLRIAVPSSPVLVVLAINRVQDICQAPVAHQVDPVELLGFLKGGKFLDVEAYKARNFNSSHIGDLRILENTESRGFDLSVLLPCHTGPPEAAKNAIRSVIMQYKTPISRMQIIVVDDRCSDGSIDAMLEAAEDAIKILGSHLVVTDHRFGGIPAGNEDFRLEIYASQKAGVAAALNLGLEHAIHDFVARMDADDISIPERFTRQLKFLHDNPSVVAVGTHTLLFSNDESREALLTNESRVNTLPFSDVHGKWKTRPSLPPSDPGLVAWAMLFSCCLSHPSVMYRKSRILNIGGYEEQSATHAEDYELWLRLTQQDPLSIISLPFIGLWHRKHRSNATKTGVQSHETQLLRSKAIKVLVGDCDNGSVKYLRHPDLAEQKADLDSAADLLLRLRECFLATHQSKISKREVELVRHDSHERLGGMAALSISRFGDRSALAWRLWCQECPDKALEQIALLCSARGTKEDDVSGSQCS